MSTNTTPRSYEELHQAILDYFGDEGRPAEETYADLRALGDHCHDLAESLSTGQQG
jgi:hypothetical protein